MLGGLSTSLYYLHASISSYINEIHLKVKTELRIHESHKDEKGGSM